MEENAKVKVKELAVGATSVIVGEFSRTKKNGSSGEYAFVRITDNTGSATSRIWNNLPIYQSVMGLENGDHVQAEVVCTKNGQYINVDLKAIEKIEKPKVTIVDIEALKEELRGVLREMKDAELRELISSVFSREDVKEAFFIVPGSQMSGYSFEGGTLAHVVRLVRLIKAVASVFAGWERNVDNCVAKLNVDLLTTVAILHDVGNIKSLRLGKQKVEKTPEGELFESSYLSMKIVLEELQKSKLRDEQKLILEHVLGSTKGKQTYGALFIPRSREAMAFHLIEALDVQMSNFEFLDRNAGVDQSFVQLFQKTLFLGSFDGD